MEPFERLVERHGAVVWRVCRAVLGPVAADDAWSETFLAALRAYPQLRPGSNVEAWLVTIAHHKALDQVRVARRQPVLVPDLPETAAQAATGDDDSGVLGLLAALPAKQRQCVAYHHVAGLSYAEVAEIVGGSVEAARRAASDGIAALRRALGQDDAPVTGHGQGNGQGNGHGQGHGRGQRQGRESS